MNGEPIYEGSGYVLSYEHALNIIEAYAGKVDPDEIVDIARHGLLGHLEWLENWEPPSQP